MCGFFFIASTSQDRIKRAKSRVEYITRTIIPRGPDAKCTYEQYGLMVIHTHLRISGFQTQPLLFNKGIAVYNGEIYNEYEKINEDLNYSDANTLLNLLNFKGVDSLVELEGEFAIVVYQADIQKVFIITDTFGTKPVYYSSNPGEVVVGSYNETIFDYDSSLNITRVPANTFLMIDVSTGKVIRSESVWKFNFLQQTKNNYDKCVNSLVASIKKKISGRGAKYFVPLSSGYDSGLISLVAANANVDVKCYSVPYLEDPKVLDERIRLLDSLGIKTEVIHISRQDFFNARSYLHEHLDYYPLIAEDFVDQNFSDSDFRNNPGFVASSIICKRARSEGRLIQLSGQGADEIMTDYSTGSMKMSQLKGCWHGVTAPWKNLLHGWNAVFLGATERISGLFGIETRYPFLDRSVVQEFIDLKPELKESTYKGAIAKYFDVQKFSYVEKKQGFAGFDIDSLSDSIV
jgi:asparagine synthetase B (glutamine-hydrolysing)